VSAPLEWKEVKRGLRPADFTIKNIKKRVDKKGDLFEGILGRGVDIPSALKKMGNHLPQ
jgi:bifunctional non-homologous end joining protein LigD